MRNRISAVVCAFLLFLVMTACATAPVPDEPEPTTTPMPSPTAQGSPTPIPTIEATSQGPENITLWLPDVLFSASGSADEATNLLSEQIAAFTESSDGISIEIRRKQVREAGGIMPTLRSAKSVAPGVLPDLTLIRREDLITAVQEDLIEPMEGVVSTAVVGELFDTALDMGQVDGALYGLPYALEVQHVIYQGELDVPSVTSLDRFLADEKPFLFPAARATGLNAVTLTQYTEAAPRPVTDGALTVDEATLLELFQYYEAAAAAGLIQPEVVNFARPTDYRALLTSDDFGSAVVSSGLYLQLTEEDVSFTVSSIPTLSGQPASTLDGWMWVMTTTNPNRQALVGEFIAFMMDADRQGAYVSSLDLLPSQRTALRQWYDADYVDFLLMLMPNAVAGSAEAAASTAARAIQNSLLLVISGERSAEGATQDVLNQLDN